MAGIGQEAVVPIRPDLATNLQPINFAVEQNAVARVSDAFRQGQITANDIVERYGELAKTKERAQIQGLEEYISPQAIEARKQQTAFMGEKAKHEISMQPIAEQTAQIQLDELRRKAEQGDNTAIRDYSIKHGFGQFLSEAGSDKAQDAKAYKLASAYEAAQQGAQRVLKDINKVPFKTVNEEGIEYIDPNQDRLSSVTALADYTPEQALKAGRLANMTPQEFASAGSPTVDEYVFGQKQSEKQPENTVQAVNELVTPRRTESTKTVTIKPDGTRVEVTKNIEVDSTSHPAGPAPLPASAIVTARSKNAPVPVPKAPTDAQQKALFALGRFGESNDMQDALKTAGFDPTSIGTWFGGMLPELLKPGNVKAYEAAKNAWTQGLLRLESGAAIAAQEKAWYEKTFFPTVNDPANVVESKRNLRSDLERMVAEVSQAGGVVSPEAAAETKRIYDRAGARAAGAGAATTSGAVSVTPLKSRPGEELINLGGGRYKVRKTQTPTD